MRLKQACEVFGEYGLNLSSEEYSDEGIYFIRTSDFNDLGIVDLTNAKKIPHEVGKEKILRYGDILFSRSGTIGRSMLFSSDVTATYAAYLVRYRLKEDIVEPHFVRFWAQSDHYWSQVRADTIESTIENFNGTKFSNLTLPTIDFPAQTAIAEFLDCETAALIN